MTGPVVVLRKRWLLREGVAVAQVADLVRTRVAPHYAALHPDVVLGLERWDDVSVVAVQRWPGRDVLDAATRGPAYDAWWRDYLPVLEAWDLLVAFHSEEEGEALV